MNKKIFPVLGKSLDLIMASQLTMINNKRKSIKFNPFFALFYVINDSSVYFEMEDGALKNLKKDAE